MSKKLVKARIHNHSTDDFDDTHTFILEFEGNRLHRHHALEIKKGYSRDKVAFMLHSLATHISSDKELD